jgi:hypothetical protein
MQEYLIIILLENKPFQTSSFIMSLTFLEEKNKSEILFQLFNYFLNRMVYFN